MKHLLAACFILLNTLLFSVEITPGMKAVMKTVISGEQIEDIEIVILGKTEDEVTFKEEMYVFELKDKRVREIGGIAEGMSGSPVFMNGNIIGAVAYAVKGNKNIGLILPLKDISDDYSSGEFLPGTSITISPTRGDVLLKASGTLTYSTAEGDAFVYSHSLNNVGNAMYFLNLEKDVFILKNNEIPYKLSKTTDEIGYIYDDRKKGLSGKLSSEIPVYSFSILMDENRKNKKVNYDISKNRNTLALYLEKSIETAMLKTLEKTEYKFAEYYIEIISDDNNVIFRDQNAIIAEAGIVGSLSNTISNDILNVVDNKFKYINFSKVNIELKVRDDSKIIYIQNVDFIKKVYTPGEKIEFEITYLIHQIGTVKKRFALNLSDEFKIGNIQVEVSTNTGKFNEEAKNLIDYLYNIENSIKNNEVMVKLKDQDGEILLQEKLRFDYYIISEKIYNQNIIIDSFEARSDN